MKKVLTEKRKYAGFYLNQSNIDFIENLKFKLRKENVSGSDLINLAIELFKKQHEADEKKAKNKKPAD